MHELLAPAGSFAALEAAVNAGADAVYFGGCAYNARMSGTNFSDAELREAALFCAHRGVRTYLTLNTLVTDRELALLPPFLELINEIGISAVIVQDIGIARLIAARAPQLPLHASTQMTVHNLYGMRRAAELGFSRIVLSRELSHKAIATICDGSPLETEVFIHGALCMSYSGQCYCSSAIAGRSGNRGMCAQPCRQRYEDGYPLSLKDLCLAGRMTELLKLPVTSFKIEGRLKSPSYVAGVVSVYRKLIDEHRNATPEETAYLAELFSRQGFTSGYFDNDIGKHMFGVRTEADKQLSQSAAAPIIEPRKRPLHLQFTASTDAPLQLTVSDDAHSVTVCGAVPQAAQTRALTAADAEKQLTKMDTLPYAPTFAATVADGLYVSAAALNALRREGLATFGKALLPSRVFLPEDRLPQETVAKTPPKTYYSFRAEAQITDIENADMLWLPLFSITENHGGKCGVVLPTILMDKELPAVRDRLKIVHKMGITKALCETIGQAELCREMGFLPCGGVGLHCFNSRTAASSEMTELTASPELTAAQLRAMPTPLPLNVVVYGRQRLMTTENCIIKNAKQCHDGAGTYMLKDIKNNEFPVLCEYPHRNAILNSRPLYMLDKRSAIPTPNAYVLCFTTETPAEVRNIIAAYKTGAPPTEAFTRGNFFKAV